MRIRTRAGVLLTATAMGAACLFGAAGPAAAEVQNPGGNPDPCALSYAHPDDSKNAVLEFDDDDVPLQWEPAAACGTIATISFGALFYAYCVTYNVYGNEWLYGRVTEPGDGITYWGWAYSGKLENYNPSGILYPCTS